MTADLHAVLEEAEQALTDEDGSASYALSLLQPRLTEEAETFDEDQWRRVLTIMRAAFANNDAPELVRSFDEQLATPTDPHAAYRLGYALVEAKLPALASGVLTRALRYSGDDLAVRNELAASLELQGRYREAAIVLEPATKRPDAPFLSRYLRAFSLIASGEATRAVPLVKTLDGDSSEHAKMRARLRQMLRRYEWAGDDRSVRAQQFILTGALLLEDELVDYREESWATLGVDLLRLRAVVERVDHKPRRVVSLRSDRQDVIALAASQLWGLPLTHEYEPSGGGLYVSDNLASIFPDVAAQLRPHQAGQIYYAHYAAANVERPVCADVIGVRGNRIISPWDLYGIIAFDYDRTDLPKGPPTESVEELAAKIVDGGRAAHQETSAALTDFAYRAAQAGLLELARDDGERERLWAWAR